MVARAVFPRVGVWKRISLAAILAFLASSCGSSSPPPTVATKVVHGPGFTFSTPAAWRVRQTDTSVAAESPDTGKATVAASVMELEKAYEPAQFAEAAKELDRVAAKLAAQLGGSVTSSRTTTVARMRIRRYSLAVRDAQGDRVDDDLGFVLSGKREVQLLCQAAAGSGDPDGACGLLFGTFKAGS
jgi:hypothetical protein